ncbi:MAG TPA: hypothetical protein VG204_17875 [Terriglobia bacterium]|nr:hypothetical protein [Terriglobia bacterium]
MSERTGDKARFGRERRAKILRRKRARDFRKALEIRLQATPAPVVPKPLVFVG